MNDNKDFNTVKRILQYCVKIETSLKRHGDSIETLKNDEEYQSAMALYVMQISELVNNLTPEFTQLNNQIPWQDIISMRHIIAHHYNKFDLKRLWDTAINDIPVLMSFCQLYFDKLKGPIVK